MRICAVQKKPVKAPTSRPPPCSEHPVGPILIQFGFVRSTVQQIMAQQLNDLAGKFGKGGAPPGLGLGLKLLGVAGAAIYGVSQSMYTGETPRILRKINNR